MKDCESQQWRRINLLPNLPSQSFVSVILQLFLNYCGLILSKFNKMPIGEIFLAAFLQVLFDKLSKSGISLFLKRRKGVRPQIIQEWQQKLKLIGAYLSDAEQKQFNSDAVKLWLQDLQDFSYDLEDILDEFLTDARLYYQSVHADDDRNYGKELDSGPYCSPLKKVPNIFTHASRASKWKRANYSARIKQISRRLQDILTQAGPLCLSQQTNARKDRPQERMGTSSLVCGSVVYGRDDDTKEGGIGKTTLAQCVYNDDQIKFHFNIRAWVTVSDVFDVKRITTAIINSVTPDTPVNFDDINKAQEELKNLLADKRFLIVLDDVWSDEYGPWDQLQIPFWSAAKGSRILTTTRIDKVAKNMIRSSTQCPSFYLKGLSNDDCWLLFEQHAPVDPDVIRMREDIVPLFKGLPLAAKALGGLLRKEDKSKWPRILKSNMWSEEGGVLPALRLSYHHLPPHLKRIFSYCSIFPRSYVFHEKDVVLMWMAEGFLQEGKEGSMEDIGRDYLADLVSRSLFEPVPYRRRSYIMHDLIHELAQWAAGDICCTIGMRRDSCRTRHFSFTFDVGDDRSGLLQPVDPNNVGQLRTFALFAKAYGCPLIKLPDFSTPRFKYLRLLSLARMKLTQVPRVIGNLSHLRLLDLSSTHVRELPVSTRNLHNLQTLLLKNCRFLEAVTHVTHLIELRHLDFVGAALVEIPRGIGKLTNLRTLNGLVLKAKHGDAIRELKYLNDLHGSLKISGIQNIVRSEDAKEAMMHEKSGLNELRMFWGASTNEVDDNVEHHVLHYLKPHESIKELLLEGYRASTFPSWLGNSSFAKIVVVRLVKCFGCNCLPPLGQLPNLKELWVIGLQGIENVGPEFYGTSCSKPFPSLRTLCFKDMTNWKDWKPISINGKGAFPCLEKLLIIDCKLLDEYSPRHLPSLEVLEIKDCYKLKVTLPRCPVLRNLTIMGCRVLSSTESVICCSEIIRLVDISEFTGFEGFQVKGFKKLVLGGYEYLERTQSSKIIEITRCPKLHNWSLDGYRGLDNKLTEVRLENCEDLMPFLLEKNLLSTVRYLFIKSFYSLKYTATLTRLCSFLEVFSIGHCSVLVTIDQLPITLCRLDLSNCRKLQAVAFEESSSFNIGGKFLLEELNVEGCKSLKSLFSTCIFPTTLEAEPPPSSVSRSTTKFLCELPNLTQLRVSECPIATVFPQGLLLPRIKTLSLTHCPNVEVLPSKVSNFISLTRLDFVDVKISQPAQEWGLDLLTSLQHLKLAFLGSSVDSVECISGPNLILPSSLSHLSISGFQNLKSILCSCFPSLTQLTVRSCMRFESLDDNDGYSKPRHVEISDCPLMAQQRQGDPDGLVHTGLIDDDGGYLSSDSYTSY
ncbi:putative disease resistance RPP13-like protein 1 isoform X2 [Amaranthus tricolor]|uniref:putative disease resistance RPP13-like protein 1 isoform X2 n=1 Tax=Amaranthus tricolor TaxID=29722 RepID=UPI002583CF63|nr:putative disease resistance RPP13-like protein 1 isoform X2 [Amaranthus tricolor]